MSKKTVEQVREEFREAGVSVKGWAEANGFLRQTVVRVLSGKSAANRGEAHRAAIALGLKSGRVVDVRKFKPAPKRP